MQPKRVIVVGGGLSGLSAATYLLDKGVKPIIIEANPYVGGRTASWQSGDMEIESGLHRFLGFYTHVPKLLRKANIDPNDILFWEDEIEIRTPHGPRAVFGLAPLFKPFKTAGSIIGNNQLITWNDKLSVARMFLAGIKDYVLRPTYLDARTVLQYAREKGVTKNAIDRILIPLTEGIFFLPIASYSAFVLFSLFVPYWKSLYKLRVGAFKGGMTKVMTGPLADYVVAGGGQVKTDEAVVRIDKQGDLFTVVTTKGRYEADAVIMAASIKAAQDIIGASFDDPWFNDMLSLRTMPSVTFQIELKHPSLPVDRTTFGPMTCMSSFAEQSRTTFRQSAGRLSVILSPPETYVHMPERDILHRVMDDAEALGIHIKNNVLGYRKVVIPHDFYALTPGASRLRPTAETSISGFYLAGDYTRQKYVATMEGAVYSGELAAKALLKKFK